MYNSKIYREKKKKNFYKQIGTKVLAKYKSTRLMIT